jgi:hypothetical protein
MAGPPEAARDHLVERQYDFYPLDVWPLPGTGRFRGVPGFRFAARIERHPPQSQMPSAGAAMRKPAGDAGFTAPTGRRAARAKREPPPDANRQRERLRAPAAVGLAVAA